MNKNLLFSLLLLQGLVLSATAAPTPRKSANWEHSIVNLEITRKQYDYQQPWGKRPRTILKSGVVTGGREILTTAEDLSDRTLVRVQKGGRGKWWNADVTWVDYHANLALLAISDDSFWKDLKAVEFLLKAPARESLQIVHWKGGNLESRKVEFSQYIVDDGRLSLINHLQLELDSGTSGLGWPEAVVSDNKLVGITCGAVGNNMRALPAPFIQSLLDAKRKGRWRGLGYFPFLWQQTENPATHQYLKFSGEPRGVVVIEVPTGKGDPLKRLDIILQVDGFDVDSQGYYRDPEFGRLLLEDLSTRNKFAGDDVKIVVWREGREQTLNFRLPKAEYSDKLVPPQVFDIEPEFCIVGGLVFQPLTGPFLRSWGPEWRRSAPFRLTYYDTEDSSPERPALVVLSSVLPDVFNMGYQDSRILVVEKVNGQKINRLPDLQDALKKPINGFHIIDFAHSDSLRRMVLDASEEPGATLRVLQRYGIPKPSNVVSRKP
jgi:hypothetical protein